MTSFILKKGKGKAAPVHSMEAYRERGVISPLFSNLGTRWR
jgi:hypothetical protein